MSPFQHGTRVRRRAAAGRAVHRDRGHVRQLRGPRAELQRRRAAAAARRGPAWKVLRVLGTLLGLPGFELDTVGGRARTACSPRGDSVAARLAQRHARRRSRRPPAPPHGLERIADVPIYFADPLVRRAPSLQQHRRRAAAAGARCIASLFEQLGLAEGAQVQGDAGPRRGGADGRRRRRRARRRGAHRRRASVDVRARGHVRSGHGGARVAWQSDRSTRSSPTRRPVFGPAWPVGVDARQDRRDRDAADPRGRVPDARRAQGDRLDAGAHRPEPRRPARACCSRSPTCSSCCSRKSSSRPAPTSYLFFLAPVLSIGPRSRHGR